MIDLGNDAMIHAAVEATRPIFKSWTWAEDGGSFSIVVRCSKYITIMMLEHIRSSLLGYNNISAELNVNHLDIKYHGRPDLCRTAAGVICRAVLTFVQQTVMRCNDYYREGKDPDLHTYVDDEKEKAG